MEQRTVRFGTELTRAEEAAAAAGVSFSEWVRRAVVRQLEMEAATTTAERLVREVGDVRVRLDRIERTLNRR